MREKVFFFGVVLILGLFFCSVAQARQDYLTYTDGGDGGCDAILQEGAIYSMKMTPFAPATLLRIIFQARGVATLEFHLWPDKDGFPNMDRELMTPVEIETENTQRYYTVDIEDQGIAIDPPRVFHVGVVRKSAAGAGLCMDPSADWALRAKYYNNGSWFENEKDWYIKVQLDYYDEPTEFVFTDVTAEAGIETLGSRVAWGDYDGDGDHDLLMNGWILYRNDGGSFTDVSDEAGLTGLPGNGGLFADFDNDGDLDIFTMCGATDNYDRFVENNGDGTFTDITDAAVVEAERDYNPSEGAAWGDFDKDDYLDLYLANYEQPGGELAIGTRDRLYRNNGDKTFTDVGPSLGLDPETTGEDYRCGRGVNWGDYNDDLWPDIYVSDYRLDPNFLYKNNGDGTLTDVSVETGVQGYGDNMAWGHTIGSAWGDVDNNGLMDLFTANLAHPRYMSFSDPSLMYINNGPPNYDFTDATKDWRVIYIETNSEPCFGDWNNDGWVDLLVTNVYENYWAQVYRNNGDGTLTDYTYYTGVKIENGWGATFADYDGDGYLDIMSNVGLWRNNGNDNHWLKVELTCNEGDPFCVGARVELQITHDKGPQAKEIAAGKGTTNEDPFELHYGLNQCEEAWRVTAKFLNGKTVTLYNVPADQRIVINEDDPSDEEPETPGEPGACADVDYSEEGWPDDDSADDTADDASDDDAPGSDSDDDDDDGCGC